MYVCAIRRTIFSICLLHATYAHLKKMLNKNETYNNNFAISYTFSHLLTIGSLQCADAYIVRVYVCADLRSPQCICVRFIFHFVKSKP